MRLRCTVNGRPRVVDARADESLLYVLRERMGLPGSKNACEQGECGSCTIYLDGVTVCACLVAAGQAEGRDIRTVEGLAGSAASVGPGERARAEDTDTAPGLRPAAEAIGALDAGTGGARGLDPVQEAFVAAGAVQCGFCTPGLIIAAHDLIERTAAAGRGVPSEAEIREALAGNLCRCTGYEKILDAVRTAAERRAAS